MISILIRVPGDAVAPLGLTLESLIPGVVRGLVGDAVVLCSPDAREVAKVADAVGASLVERAPDAAGWAHAAARARGHLVLMLDAGDVLAEPWISVVERHLASAPASAACLPRVGEGVAGRAGAWLMALVRPREPGPGIIAPRQAVAAGRLPEGRPLLLRARILRRQVRSGMPG